MTDYSLFAQSGGILSDEHERINQSVFASTEKSDDETIKRIPTLSFAQPPSRHFLGTCLPPQLANIRRTAERFITNPSNDLLRVHNAANTISKQEKESSTFNDEIEDADFATCILNNLPTSYDDFETKELHLKLERNLSSPLMTCQSPNTDSGRVSAGSSLTKSSTIHPHDSANMPLDADDMEVAMINESFEEQQKQHKLYENPGLKDLFYSQPNVPSDDRNDTMLGSSHPTIAAQNAATTFDSGIFMANRSCFGAMQLKTPDIADSLNNKSETSVLASNISPNMAITPPLQMLPSSFGDLFSVDSKERNSVPFFTVDDNMDATEALAVDVVESLFADTSLNDTTALPTLNEKKKYDILNLSSEIIQVKKESVNSAVDSWEELDRDDFKPEFGDMFQTQAVANPFSKVQKPYALHSQDMPHVLEAYDLSMGYTEADVKEELAKHNFMDVGIQKVDDSRCLVVFSSANAALQALIAARQQYPTTGILLRSLCNATSATQEKAQLYEPFLRPFKPRPDTTALVARRLIEGALGKRSNVSAETIRAERKQLKEAKDNKLAKAAIWDNAL